MSSLLAKGSRALKNQSHTSLASIPIQQPPGAGSAIPFSVSSNHGFGESRPSSTKSVNINLGKSPSSHGNISDGNMKGMNPKVRTILKKRKKKKITIMDRKQEEDYLEELMISQRLEYMSRKTHFNPDEINNLYRMFNILVTKSTIAGEMDRTIFSETFQKHFGITDDIMLDQMFYSFDSNHGGSVSVTEWVMNLSIMLRGNIEEQIRYCYNMYDMNGDGGIGRSEIAKLLEGCLIKIPGVDDDITDHPREIYDTIFKKLDYQQTGQITYSNFRDAIYRDPLLLESLGQCLPMAEKIQTFLVMVTEFFNDYTPNYSLEGDAIFASESTKHMIHQEKYRKAFYKNETALRSTTPAYIRARRNWMFLKAVSHLGIVKKRPSAFHTSKDDRLAF